MVAEFIDEARSARTDERPQFQRLLADARRKPRPFDLIIVRKFDRFARNVTQSRIAKEHLKKLGIRVISVHEDVDEGPAGKFMETMLEAVAEWYSENLAAEIVRTDCAVPNLIDKRTWDKAQQDGSQKKSPARAGAYREDLLRKKRLDLL